MHPLDHHTTEVGPNKRSELQHTHMHEPAPGSEHAAMSASHGAHHDQHSGHAGHSAAMFQRPFWISLVLTIPIVIYAEMIQAIVHYQAPAFPGSYWLSPILASVIYWYGSWVFLKGAFDELRVLRPGMMTLVTLAISTAYFYSLAISFGLLNGMPFYWEQATLTTIMLLGHWMEMRAVGSAQSALNELAKLLPDMAERIASDGSTQRVPANGLSENDLVLVRPGGQIPADGRVEEGKSQLNESMITGESRPVDKQAGDEVIAGTVNGSGSLRIRITRTGEQTMLAGIMRLVAEAQNSRSRAQALADRAAFWLTLVALGVAIITLIAWTIAQGFDNTTVERVVSTLVVACPHALGLAIPLVIAITTTLSARNGILVRDRLALEQARLLSAVVFDKTGTLTTGQQGLVALRTTRGMSEEEALALAAAVEQESEHIIARAIVSAAQQRKLSIPRMSEFEALAGRGAQARVAERILKVGGPRLLEQEGITLNSPLKEAIQQWGKRGQTVVYLVEGQEILAAFALADVIRPESYEAVKALKEQGLRVAMLTGDSQEVANWVAGELGLDEVFAQVLPAHKSEKIRELQQSGAKVAMVGDGVNDAPALAQADVGIAIGAGTDVARASAGIVLVRNDPRDIARIIRLSWASYRKMMQNLAWAAGYNIIALPLAAGILAPFGFVLPPAVSALLMSLSTIIVALNAQTLRKLHL
ncbi:copper-translocating P-type ATPase [Reticulibacter mediterranei]|uniref:Copper-translocating P-type ATPase n=1 Tax=Reticulibacter mediterranei TaxID=2778369 RepID=A0A8J3N661_9CHLR|nr:heavy metal translocating P-type ATPase [Reticulibacter mediterranei]GHO97075.1 copper-translocating P-type ATPase [Reticulibacter mediterranei]